MAETATRLESLQFGRREIRRLGLALALSLLAHLLIWGGYQAARKFDVARWLPRIAWLKPKAAPLAPNREAPLEFVMVDRSSADAPKNTKYYSNNNSRMANPDADRNANVPKVNGTQMEVPKAETVPKPDYNKLQPAPKPASEPAQSQPVVEPGDLTLGKPQTTPPTPEQVPPRPRTLQQALAQSHQSPGVAMKQEGGVSRHLETSLFDAKATLIGQYDSDFVDAVTYRWYALLESQQFALDRSGKVVVQFNLNYDGTITGMTILENTVGDLLGYVCRKAITDPAPFKPWPEQMRRDVGANSREITFTFYYY